MLRISWSSIETMEMHGRGCGVCERLSGSSFDLYLYWAV